MSLTRVVLVKAQEPASPLSRKAMDLLLAECATQPFLRASEGPNATLNLSNPVPIKPLCLTWGQITWSPKEGL